MLLVEEYQFEPTICPRGWSSRDDVKGWHHQRKKASLYKKKGRTQKNYRRLASRGTVYPIFHPPLSPVNPFFWIFDSHGVTKDGSLFFTVNRIKNERRIPIQSRYESISQTQASLLQSGRMLSYSQVAGSLPATRGQTPKVQNRGMPKAGPGELQRHV